MDSTAPPEIIAGLVAWLVGPIVTDLVKRYAWAKGLAPIINTAASCAIGLGGWALLGGDWRQWILWGVGASMIAMGQRAARERRG